MSISNSTDPNLSIRNYSKRIVIMSFSELFDALHFERPTADYDENDCYKILRELHRKPGLEDKVDFSEIANQIEELQAKIKSEGI